MVLNHGGTDLNGFILALFRSEAEDNAKASTIFDWVRNLFPATFFKQNK
jgi:hypothetical protein